MPPVELPLSPQPMSNITPSISLTPSAPTNNPSTPTPSSSQPLTTESLIIIPKIGLEARIVPDLEPQNLMEGVGHDPSTEQPGAPGVCILYGHRFLNYTDPSSGYFYLLDKLSAGDLVVVYWEGKSYHYVVQESMTINPDDFSIYRRREKPTLVLVTCTPLWSDRFRLVVIAEPSAG